MVFGWRRSSRSLNYRSLSVSVAGRALVAEGNSLFLCSCYLVDARKPLAEAPILYIPTREKLWAVVCGLLKIFPYI